VDGYGIWTDEVQDPTLRAAAGADRIVFSSSNRYSSCRYLCRRKWPPGKIASCGRASSCRQSVGLPARVNRRGLCTSWSASQTGKVNHPTIPSRTHRAFGKRASDVVYISTQWRLESVVHGPGRPVSTREGGARLRFEPDRSNERCTHIESESESYRAASARKRVFTFVYLS